MRKFIDSFLFLSTNYYKKLFGIRKQLNVITDGQYKLLDEQNPDVFAYIRYNEEESILVVCNFRNEEIKFEFDINSIDNVILSNDCSSSYLRNKILNPFEALVLKLK